MTGVLAWFLVVLPLTCYSPDNCAEPGEQPLVLEASQQACATDLASWQKSYGTAYAAGKRQREIAYCKQLDSGTSISTYNDVIP